MDLKICVVASYFYPKGYGGNAVYELCQELVTRGIKVNVVTSRLPNVPNIQTIHGIDVHRIPTCFLRLFNTEYPFSANSVVEIAKVAKTTDLIHANFEIFQTALTSGIVKRVLKKPMVLSMHGQGRNSAASYGTKMLDIGYSINHNTIERFSVQSADRIIALTKSVTNKALKLGAKFNKISIIPNGVNTDRFKPICVPHKYFEDLKLPLDAKIVAFVGRLHSTHGIELLLDAILIITRVRSDLVFLIVGDGPKRAYVTSYIRANNLEKNVRLLGYRTDIPELLNTAEFLVYPALSVGMPLTVLEAMACGKAVLAFNLSGNRELIIDCKTGFLVQQIDSTNLATSILRALSESDSLKVMGQNAKTFVEHNFTWKHTASKVIHVYSNLINNL